MVFVAGHQRPDTDAAVSAHVMAKLRQRLDRRRQYQPLLLGEPNRQTRWLFKQARTALPPERRDIRWTVAESMRELPIALPPNARLGDAIGILQNHRISMIPVVDDENHFLGVVSPRLPRNEYFFNFNVEDYLGLLLSIEDVVAAFSLRAIHTNPSGPPPSRLGSFRVASGKVSKIESGDVLFAPADAKLIRSAERAGAQAVIVADAKLKDARAAAQAARAMPVYFYPGSMLALLSSLSLAIPLQSVMAGEIETLRPEQRLDQVLGTLAKAKHALPVLDAEGKLVGVLSQNDAIARPARPLILVDHFERTQTVVGVDQAAIEEIVDHHRVGAIETLMPARVDCRPVGSTATIIACQFEEAGLEPKPREALLLLGALVSDTLLLTSPTTTAIDRRVGPQLAKIAGVELDFFGREVLHQNDELADGAPDKLVERDVKAFVRGEVHFGAAQLETVDLGQLTAERSEALVAALERLRQRSGWATAALIVTDVLKGDSRLFVADEDGDRRGWLLEDAPVDRGRLHRGMVSRKKQLLPFLFERLDTFRS
ncbi:MAG: putative manganese-dependent inorganic diphosphatase [Synoicihabitans sp.]